MMTTIYPLTPATRRLLSLAALGVASLAWGQEAPPAPPLAGQAPAADTAAPAPSPAPGVATAAPDHILPAADPNTPAGSTLAGILSGNSTAVSTIQRQEYSTRDQLLSEINDRVQLADRRVAELQQSNGHLDDQGKQVLQTSVADYTSTKQKLQQSLEAARSAKSDTWERTRSRLASDFAFWVSAAAAVELASPK